MQHYKGHIFPHEEVILGFPMTKYLVEYSNNEVNISVESKNVSHIKQVIPFISSYEFKELENKKK